MSLELPSQESSSSSILAVPISQYFKNAQHFSLGNNSNLSTVHGNQHNYYNPDTELKRRRFIVGTEEEEAEYAEFPEIKRGEFVAIRDVFRGDDHFYHREQRKLVKWDKCGRTAVVGDVRFGGVASRCTVVQYSGEGAGEVSGGSLNEVLLPKVNHSYGRRTFKGFVELGRLDGMLRLDEVLRCSQTSRERATGGNQSVKCPNAQLILPETLTGWLSDSAGKRQRREESPPIYLFIPPLSTTTFWSFNPDGQNPITTDLCHHLGLPISLELKCYEYYWRTEIYKTLRTYQIGRGFDPNTNEFARHNQYCIYKIVEQPFSSRFEEIKSSEPTETSLHPEDISLGALSGDVQPDGETPFIWSINVSRLIFHLWTDPTANATTHGHVLQKSARYSPDYPDKTNQVHPIQISQILCGLTTPKSTAPFHEISLASPPQETQRPYLRKPVPKMPFRRNVSI
ncbi:hypothetical protein V5O48_004596 [Marasmius crinis-equi]|uniref:Uncharacterized protein n=1 Tax=Marasmius crinis-equi TaxID=585013 RepID=A0ABR3FPK4_9AGAR